ncbi:MAG: type III-A CRISPR-associated protein Csm2 [Candidatus Aenigmarchaeota archaeon]|nr:type III-A CRISPR-associated protein Csm2 [Candidatus Aenigmarchaeota archaeon]
MDNQNKYQNQNELFFDKRIIFDSEDPKEFIEHLESLKNKLGNSTKSQIRKFYDEICNIKEDNLEDQNKIKSHVAKLMIMLKYAENRKVIDNRFSRQTMRLLEHIMDNPKKSNYERFRKFFEGLLAYYGG